MHKRWRRLVKTKEKSLERATAVKVTAINLIKRLNDFSLSAPQYIHFVKTNIVLFK